MYVSLKIFTQIFHHNFPFYLFIASFQEYICCTLFSHIPRALWCRDITLLLFVIIFFIFGKGMTEASCCWQKIHILLKKKLASNRKNNINWTTIICIFPQMQFQWAVDHRIIKALWVRASFTFSWYFITKYCNHLRQL